jgi:chlorobactene glucosyltransferase
MWWRTRDSRSLDDYPAGVPTDAPLVSVIVPARDEARNVARCVRSILATTYPAVELLVVDDHSTDGTAALARAAAPDDPRLTVLDNPPLPMGWMGKQWACSTGARHARGAILCFADADTTHTPDLLARTVAALQARSAALLSVAGRQEMGTVWEKLVQPQVFAVIAGRYGGTERVSRSRRTVDKIANGQCLLMTRAAYDHIGGHASVRDVVVEDLKLAQRTHAAGLPVHLILGERQLATRMYTSLGELVRGWRKNVFAGGREAMPFGRVGQLLFPFLLLFPALAQLWPLASLAGWTLGIVTDPVEPRASLLATGATLLFWTATYHRAGLSPLWALAYPAGALLYLAIALQAIARGQRVEWRGRHYVSATETAPSA